MSDLNKLRMAQIRAAEAAATADLPALLGVTKEEFERRMNAPYSWPTDENGRRVAQGDCSECRRIDKRHPEGTACDYSCVGV